MLPVTRLNLSRPLGADSSHIAVFYEIYSFLKLIVNAIHSLNSYCKDIIFGFCFFNVILIKNFEVNCILKVYPDIIHHGSWELTCLTRFSIRIFIIILAIRKWCYPIWAKDCNDIIGTMPFSPTNFRFKSIVLFCGPIFNHSKSIIIKCISTNPIT
ncbi:MAG TPA: hypothetical protein [Caudoviricetes sp.]|nr:MAG TPA: hypothetical protein [Caudoviricetes sp.]